MDSHQDALKKTPPQNASSDLVGGPHQAFNEEIGGEQLPSGVLGDQTPSPQTTKDSDSERDDGPANGVAYQEADSESDDEDLESMGVHDLFAKPSSLPEKYPSDTLSNLCAIAIESNNAKFLETVQEHSENPEVFLQALTNVMESISFDELLEDQRFSIVAYLLKTSPFKEELLKNAQNNDLSISARSLLNLVSPPFAPGDGKVDILRFFTRSLEQSAPLIDPFTYSKHSQSPDSDTFDADQEGPFTVYEHLLLSRSQLKADNPEEAAEEELGDLINAYDSDLKLRSEEEQRKITDNARAVIQRVQKERQTLSTGEFSTLTAANIASEEDQRTITDNARAVFQRVQQERQASSTGEFLPLTAANLAKVSASYVAVKKKRWHQLSSYTTIEGREIASNGKRPIQSSLTQEGEVDLLKCQIGEFQEQFQAVYLSQHLYSRYPLVEALRLLDARFEGAVNKAASSGSCTQEVVAIFQMTQKLLENYHPGMRTARSPQPLYDNIKELLGMKDETVVGNIDIKGVLPGEVAVISNEPAKYSLDSYITQAQQYELERAQKSSAQELPPLTKPSMLGMMILKDRCLDRAAQKKDGKPRMFGSVMRHSLIAQEVQKTGSSRTNSGGRGMGRNLSDL